MKTQPTSREPMSRRHLLKVGSTTAVAALAAGCDDFSSATKRNSVPAAVASKSKLRNVILCVSDGMSMGVPSMADDFSLLVCGRPTFWPAFMLRPGVTCGLMRTASASSMVTDSAAASSAWSTGQSVANGTLNVTPDGATYAPLAVGVGAIGKRVGLVTTDNICGATPGGFGAAVVSRHDYPSIARQYLGRVDLLLGGGREHFDPLGRKDGKNLIGQFREDGYAFFDQRSALMSAKPQDKVLGLFNEGTLPYTIDHLNDAELKRRIPSLREMTDYALRCLESAEEGFFMMIEGSRIDHAAHANDAAACLWDQLAFDDAARRAVEYALDRDDTLVILTTDHGNANPGLCGWGNKYNDSTERFKRLGAFTGSFTAIARDIKQRSSPESTAKVIQRYTGIELDETETRQVDLAVREGEPVADHNDQHRRWVGLLGQVLGNHTAVQWNGVSHTSDNVLVSAYGPYSEHFAGVHHLAHFNDLITKKWALSRASVK